MKLDSFNIQNYRSIVHSGWKTLAYDNITALIGQNESGKTSVLEALQSFYDGNINEDVLRSDLSLPVVSCKFSLENKKLSNFINSTLVDPELFKILRELDSFSLTRQWKEDRTNILFISSEEILNFYEAREIDRAKIEEETQEQISDLLIQAEALFNELEGTEQAKIEAQEKLTESRKNLDEKQRNFKRAKKPDQKLIAEKELESAQTSYNIQEENFKKKLEAFENKKLKTQSLSERVSICNKCKDSAEKVVDFTDRLCQSQKEYREALHIFEVSVTEKEQKNAQTRLDQAKANYENLIKEHREAKNVSDLNKIVASKVLNGISLKQAISEAETQLAGESTNLDIYQLGEILYNEIPVFEFFEDFSSLLPNKIDLDDVLTGNTQVEGYKAAQNFLKIAGLNAEFFWEKNHRILKQKIENLNGEISINFQDYWSQNVGKDNKIKLNFELEHYDYTHPEKSGKPYLEFWIKDRSERLYPKQRSRGVRWFLSFYLELKAAASDNHAKRVLLIDEPGLSLHARAQEDVLKVFDDLRTNMQIVYCTHSPHLVDIEKLYRLLAVQRANEEDDKSETLILDANSLASATTDTLTPIYSLMGVRLSNQQFIHPDNNIILEDTITYYYLVALSSIMELDIEPYFIPASGLSNIFSMINIFTGWKLGFSILLFHSQEVDEIVDEIKSTTIIDNRNIQREGIIVLKDFSFIEDIFSTLDFKKHLLKKRVGITEKNSEYIQNNDLSRTILASEFVNDCRDKKISLKDLDNQTRDNIQNVFGAIMKNLR